VSNFCSGPACESYSWRAGMHAGFIVAVYELNNVSGKVRL